MKTLSYSNFRSRLAKAMDEVNDDHAPILVTRQRGAPAVLISLDEFESMEETGYLMRSPTNAAHLRRGIAAVKAGKTRRRKLLK